MTNLQHINPPLRPFATLTSKLELDPKNARRHPQKNLDAIVASLRRACRAIELEPKYVDVAIERYVRLTGKEPTRHDGKTWSLV